MLVAALVAILVTMVLALTRAVVGRSLYDRILAINMFGTKTVLFIAVVGFLTEGPNFLDVAFVYALINFVSTVAVLRLSHYREAM